MSEKVRDHHLSRRAILYVRQSSARQIEHNEESKRLQYAMRDRLRLLGCRDVDVIDDDLGRSARGDAQRPGFQRLVALVSMGEVGIVAAREVSRFARNSREWQQLLEVCRLVDTLLVDHDAVYDVRQSNDRLLLGLKGNLSEYELELLRVRAHEARLAKTERGEYLVRVAVGYQRTEDDRLEKSSDRRVREAIDLVFAKMLELGSVRRVLLWMASEQLELPSGARGRVIWKSARYSRIYTILTNPVYAGAYAYGRSKVSAAIVGGAARAARRAVPRSTRTILWDHHEPYVDRDTFERIQKMIEHNAQARSRTIGAARRGSSLLAGLLRCRRCGQKLLVSYSGAKHDVCRYECSRKSAEEAGPRCISFSSIDVDARLSEALVAVVRPGAIEAALAAATHERSMRDKTASAIENDLEAARYAATRAWRQYDAVDPENRLVADDLERKWNAALERVKEIERHIAERMKEDLPALPSPERFATLAADLETLWNAETTDRVLKKRIARALIEEIVADVEDDREIVLVVHWKGGVHTQMRIAKRTRGHNRLRTPTDAVEAIRALALICDDQHIAMFLSRAGLKTATGRPWSQPLVGAVRSAQGIAPRAANHADDWSTLDDAIKRYHVAPETLRAAVMDGALDALRPLANGPWIFRHADLQRWVRARPTRRDHAAPSSEQLALVIPRR
jgi:DNA invertase Pin-like site-specific DNA recombinase